MLFLKSIFFELLLLTANFLLITRETTPSDSTLDMGLFFLPHLLSIMLWESEPPLLEFDLSSNS